MSRWKWRAIATMSLVMLSSPALVSGHEPHPNGRLRLAWEQENIKAVTSVDMDSRTSGTMLVRSTKAARVEVRSDRTCAVGAILMFDIDDSFAFNIDETVELEVVVDTQTTDGIVYFYDRAARRPISTDVRIPKEKSRFQSIVLVLERARLSNRLLAASDFALAARGALPLSAGPGDTPEIAVCGIHLKREGKTALQSGEKGSFELKVRDGTDGAITPARVGLYDAHGRLPRPHSSAVSIRRWGDDAISQVETLPGVEIWPDSERYVFFIDGQYEAILEAGTYDLVIGKGPEFRVLRKRVLVEAGKRTQLDLSLSRWIDMPSMGWYSSDDHVHLRRSPTDNRWISDFLQAEDVHVANVLQMGNLGGYFFPQYAFGSEGSFSDGDHVLVSGQESPRTTQLGHVIGLNTTRYHHSANYNLYNETIEAVRQDGGLSGYAHVIQPIAQATHAEAGMALDLAHGLVDFAEIMQFGKMETDLFYDFLNLGFKLVPSAGSDWPYLGLPGAERYYVQVGAAGFSTPSFFEGMRAGRVFVTNGPMLALDVAGHLMGADLQLTRGDSVAIKATARQNPDYGELDRLELVVHGEVLKSVVWEPGMETLELTHELHPRESQWLAIRAYGKDDGRAAHSAPVYLIVDGESRFWKTEAVPGLVAHYKAVLESARSQEVDWATQHEKDSVSAELLSLQWEAQKDALARRISWALEYYDTLLEESHR